MPRRQLSGDRVVIADFNRIVVGCSDCDPCGDGGGGGSCPMTPASDHFFFEAFGPEYDPGDYIIFSEGLGGGGGQSIVDGTLQICCDLIDLFSAYGLTRAIAQDGTAIQIAKTSIDLVEFNPINIFTPEQTWGELSLRAIISPIMLLTLRWEFNYPPYPSGPPRLILAIRNTVDEFFHEVLFIQEGVPLGNYSIAALIQNPGSSTTSFWTITLRFGGDIIFEGLWESEESFGLPCFAGASIGVHAFGESVDVTTPFCIRVDNWLASFSA